MPGWLRRAAAWASRSDPAGVRAGDLLDRDLALQALVEGPVDGAHATRSHALEDPEATHDQLAHHSGFSFAAGPPDPSGPATVRALAAPRPTRPGQGSYSRR